MRVIFDAALITERGTSVATFDYAKGCASVLGVEPIILYNKNAEHQPAALKHFGAHFDLIGYDHLTDIDRIAKELKVDVYYKLKYEYRDHYRPAGIFSAVHCAFDFDEPHGEVYGYVSGWLSDYVSHGKRPFVPHIVELPEPQADQRRAWGIPDDALIVGRYGGATTFDLEFAHEAVRRVVAERKDIWFVFVNTQKFCDHERILFKPAIYSAQDKADYIASCDIMLHARSLGETFGLAIAEFIYGNKPFLCWIGGHDRHHLWLQTNPAFVYRTGKDLLDKLSTLRKEDCVLPGGASRSFTTTPVVKAFKEVFLSGPNPQSTAETGFAMRSQRKLNNLLRRQLDGMAINWNKIAGIK